MLSHEPGNCGKLSSYCTLKSFLFHLHSLIFLSDCHVNWSWIPNSQCLCISKQIFSDCIINLNHISGLACFYYMQPILGESYLQACLFSLYISWCSICMYIYLWHYIIMCASVIGLLFFLLEQVNCQGYTTHKTSVVEPLLYVSLSDHYFHWLFYV